MVRSSQTMIKSDSWKSFLLIIFSLVFVLGFFSDGVRAQGTAISLEDAELTEGDTVTLYVTLTEAIDGLGRLDASIVPGNPEVIGLKSISPEAVSDQFLQIDSESEEEIKFKLVDLNNNIDPGDQNVQLVSFEIEGMKAGEAELNLESIKYTDEEGNLIEPNVNSGKVTVLSSEPEPEEPSTTGDEKEEDKPKPDEEPEEEKKKEKEKPPDEETPKETTPETEKENDYALDLEAIHLREGGKGKVTLNLSALPGGFRLAETTIISDGVEVNNVTGQDPLYREVVNSSQDSIHFRVGDFGDEIGPGTSELNLAEVQLEGVRVGWANVRIRTAIQTDEGEEVIRTAKTTDIKVVQTSILGSDNPPQDLDEDGLYEDVDGDGELTEKDVFALASNIKSDSDGISAPLLNVFDFNKDGVVNFDDAVKLMRMVKDKE